MIKLLLPESGMIFPILHQSESFLPIKLQLKPQLLVKPSLIPSLNYLLLH